MARPKTKDIKKIICSQLAHGIPIQDILSNEDNKKMQGWPTWDDVCHWLKTDELFQLDYEQSRIFGADYVADKMLGLIDYLKADNKRAAAVRAAMEIMKWQTMVRNPKYSERTIQETKTQGPMDPEKVANEIKRLKGELKVVKT